MSVIIKPNSQFQKFITLLSMHQEKSLSAQMLFISKKKEQAVECEDKILEKIFFRKEVPLSK